jgi:hypothetical protein
MLYQCAWCWHKFYGILLKTLFMFQLSTRLHAYLDYFFSLFLMLAPAIFGFGEADRETIIPILAGMMICFYSFFTNYEGGLYPRLSVKMHYVLDLAIGVMVMFSPWLFGFHNSVYKPHVLIGLFISLIAIVSLKPLVTLRKSGLQKPVTGLSKIQLN